MDLLTHTLSGVAIGTVIAGFSKNGVKEKFKIFALTAVGGAFPDIDAISLWSGFDKTFGKVFNLTHTGKDIYVGKYGYSHHGFFHSILASLIFAFIIGLLIYAFQKNRASFINSFKSQSLLLIGFISGFILHLLEDMPTPIGAWGGVRLLWPLKLYIGGTGDIWWWNNYDIFLIVVGCILINGLILSINHVAKIDLGKLTILIFSVALIFCMVQIKMRGYDFNPHKGVTYQQYEQKSKEIQRRILGDKVFGAMVKFDNKVPLNF